MLAYAATGVALGVITGIPIGMVNVTIVDAGHRLGLRRALGIGLGGALADAAHVALAVAGVSALLARHQRLAPVLYAVSGIVLLAYGVAMARSAPSPGSGARGREPGFGRGVALGLSITLPNPAALGAWTVVVGALLPGATRDQGLAAAAGVGVGSLAWFWLLGYLASRDRDLLRPAGAWLTRAFAVVIIGCGAWSIGRAVTSIEW